MWRFKSKAAMSWTVGMLCLCALLVGCGTENQSEVAKTKQVRLTISVTASLTDAMKAIAPLYQQQNQAVKIDYNFASSGSLQRQIEQGAPVDIFISAAAKQMDALQAKGLLLADTRKNILRNSIVLIVPKTYAAISDFQDLTSSRVQKMSIGEPESVPAGRYAREVLNSLEMYDRAKGKIVFAKDVRQVLAYVETENVDAGIVYQTDAKISDRVKIVAIAPENSHGPVLYPVAVIKDSKNAEAAKEFVQFLLSDAVGEVFEEYGFTRVQEVKSECSII